MKIKLAGTLALVASISLFSPTPPAQGADLMQVLKNLAGNVGGWSDLDARRAQVEKKIQDGVASGKLTATQAADFRAELARIEQAETQAKSGGKVMSFVQSISFSNDLGVLESSIDQATQQSITSLPDVDALKEQLKSKIDMALAAGQLTQSVADSLRTDLRNVAQIEAAYKAETGGNLTSRQIELLAERLDKVKAGIDEQIKLTQSAVPALNERRATLEKKITDAVASGRLHQQDAFVLKQELDKMAAQQAGFQGTANGLLSGAQVLILAGALDDLSDKINSKLTTPVVDTAQIDIRRDQIAGRITSLVGAGKLLQADANDARQDLDQINSLAIAYKATAGGITVSQVQRLAADLDRLNARIDRQIQASTPAAPPPPSPQPIPASQPSTPVATVSLPILGAKHFADVQGYWGEPYIIELSQRGVIGGFPDGNFRPTAYITRAQFAAIAARALRLPASDSSRQFTDVAPTHWAASAIASASNAGLITGFPDGTFKPEENITRAQALVVLSKALRGVSANMSALNSYSDNNAVPGWAASSIATAATAHIIVNFPDPAQIRPNVLATRGDVAALMYQTLLTLGYDLPKIRIGVLASGAGPHGL